MKVGAATRVPPSNCTNCGALMDAVSGVAPKRPPRTPSPGSMTVCIKCGHVMIFDKHLRLRDPVGKEFLAIAGDKRLLAIQQARSQLADTVAERKKDIKS
jgi:hypothetical protein